MRLYDELQGQLEKFEQKLFTRIEQEYLEGKVPKCLECRWNAVGLDPWPSQNMARYVWRFPISHCDRNISATKAGLKEMRKYFPTDALIFRVQNAVYFGAIQVCVYSKEFPPNCPEGSDCLRLIPEGQIRAIHDPKTYELDHIELYFGEQYDPAVITTLRNEKCPDCEKRGTKTSNEGYEFCSYCGHILNDTVVVKDVDVDSRKITLEQVQNAMRKVAVKDLQYKGSLTNLSGESDPSDSALRCTCGWGSIKDASHAPYCDLVTKKRG